MSKQQAKDGGGSDGDAGFEASIDEVERIIEQIESGELGLDEQIDAYERGARLIQRCRDVLQKAGERVRAIDEELDRLDADGADGGERA